MRSAPRTLLALLLTAATVVVPSAAWFVVGGREAEREAAKVVAEPHLEAERAAQKLAAQIGERLEALRNKESERPFYHYQGVYHDPAGASEGASLVPSPLSRGPDDPLVLAHFQVSAAGAITLPTLEDVVARKSGLIARQREVARSLRPAMPPLIAELGLRDAPQQSDASAAKGQIEVLDRSAYVQNVQSSQLFRDIKQKRSKLPSTPPSPSRKVAVETSGMAWRTLELGGRRTLAALRTVRGPESRWMQGFLVDGDEISRQLSVAALPARFVSRMDAAAATMEPVPRTDWAIAVESGAGLARSRAEADAIRERFRGSFALGVLAAALAGLCVVWLVWQSERLAQQRSRFAASAAHELRTPLAGLRMYGEMLAEGLGDPTRARSYARTMAAEADRLGRVVSNVLGFTRLERGTLRVEPQVGDLGAAVGEAVQRHLPALETAGACVALEVDPGLPHARFDPDAVHQILHNLLDNAERHTRSARDRTITISVTKSPPGIALRVADRGPGLSRASRAHRFRALQSGHDSGSSAGLGLGLAMVDALARAQGGALSYADVPGGGASFAITFPAAG